MITRKAEISITRRILSAPGTISQHRDPAWRIPLTSERTRYLFPRRGDLACIICRSREFLRALSDEEKENKCFYRQIMHGEALTAAARDRGTGAEVYFPKVPSKGNQTINPKARGNLREESPAEEVSELDQHLSPGFYLDRLNGPRQLSPGTFATRNFRWRELSGISLSRLATCTRDDSEHRVRDFAKLNK